MLACCNQSKIAKWKRKSKKKHKNQNLTYEKNGTKLPIAVYFLRDADEKEMGGTSQSDKKKIRNIWNSAVGIMFDLKKKACPRKRRLNGILP